MKHNATFDYSIGDTVRIKAISMIGRIESMSIDERGHMYRVAYWNDGQRNSTWMYSWELEAENVH